MLFSCQIYLIIIIIIIFDIETAYDCVSIILKGHPPPKKKKKESIFSSLYYHVLSQISSLKSECHIVYIGLFVTLCTMVNFF